ncbi:transglycosylase [Bacillus paralicheniformis]|uniref:transglycosylase n=1 Tax=Bacillus paralicheniformis TaxID=1648923 RepID=UPI001F4CD74D|nr:transglycosylase [Bacillus paralicheniformis]
MAALATKHQTCVCDHCGTKLHIKGCSKVRKHDNGVRQHYIKCPRCQTEYTSYYTNETIRRMQQKVKKLTVLRLKAQAQKGIDVYKQKYTQAREELETAMLQLREEMETPRP